MEPNVWLSDSSISNLLHLQRIEVVHQYCLWNVCGNNEVQRAENHKCMPSYANISKEEMSQLTFTVRQEQLKVENSFLLLIPAVTAHWWPFDGIQMLQFCQCQLGPGRYQQSLARVGMLADDVSQLSQTKPKLGRLCGHSAHTHTHTYTHIAQISYHTIVRKHCILCNTTQYTDDHAVAGVIIIVITSRFTGNKTESRLHKREWRGFQVSY